MQREGIVFGLTGVCFGLLVGWIIGSQQTRPAPAAPTAAVQRPSAQAPAQPPSLDERRIADLQVRANAAPNDAVVRAELGNLYYDAERCELAVPWYEASLKINPKNVDVSTDLGVCYFRTNQVDRALEQIDRSLALDPRHLKTLLNQGIVRATGKGDREGATQSWERLIAIAPTSEEAQLAKQALDVIKAGHGTGTGAPPPGGRGGRP